MLHLNISSLPYHFDEFDKLLNSLHIKFNIIGIAESHLKLTVQPLVNINFKNYNTEETPTGSGKGEALLYISSDINYKVLKGLNIYEVKKLESIFIEITNKNRRNCIIGCIYKNPKISIQEFNNILMPTLEIISKENNDACLMGDFKINLINYDSQNPTSQFLDGICSNSFFPYIYIPTRHTPKSITSTNMQCLVVRLLITQTI